MQASMTGIRSQKRNNQQGFFTYTIMLLVMVHLTDLIMMSVSQRGPQISVRHSQILRSPHSGTGLKSSLTRHCVSLGTSVLKPQFSPLYNVGSSSPLTGFGGGLAQVISAYMVQASRTNAHR